MNRAGRLFPCSGHKPRLLGRAGAAVLLGSFVTGVVGGQSTAPLRPLANTRFTLPNGLVAILNEDHATPIVSVQVWYHVGSKDDAPDRPALSISASISRRRARRVSINRSGISIAHSAGRRRTLPRPPRT